MANNPFNKANFQVPVALRGGIFSFAGGMGLKVLAGESQIEMERSKKLGGG